MDNNLTGQWKGTSDGNSYVILNITQNQGGITGRVSLFETVQAGEEKQSYWTWSILEGSFVGAKSIEGEAYKPIIYNINGNPLTEDELATLQQKSGGKFPNKTTFKGEQIDNDELVINWRSTYSSGEIRNDKVTIIREPPRGNSKVKHEEMSWGLYKEYALNQNDGVIYRGQAKKWRLQTSFHRTGHADIIEYLDEKILQVERHINAYSEHVYNIKDDHSLGALLNLIQHHGYPTPLLDWTKSPYVASFFAFQDKARLKKDGAISIYIFDEREWAKMAGRYAPLRTPAMMVKTVELPIIGNTRVLPQQATTMYSNVDDIEFIIQQNEERIGRQFLKAVSIPVADREIAMRDLNLMGITWASLFPGVDGLCKYLSTKHFE